MSQKEMKAQAPLQMEEPRNSDIKVSFFNAVEDTLRLPLHLLAAGHNYLSKNFYEKTLPQKAATVLGVCVGLGIYGQVHKVASSLSADSRASQSAPAPCNDAAVKAELEKIKAQGFVVGCPTPEAK